MPAEIRDHVYRCIIPLKDTFVGGCDPPAVKSRHLMRDYKAIPDQYYHAPGTPKDSGYAPVKFSLHVPQAECSPEVHAELLDTIQFRGSITPVGAVPANATGYTRSLHSAIAIKGDMSRYIRGNLKKIENDFCHLWLLDEYILFVKGLVKAEGFVYTNASTKPGFGQWHGANMDKSILKEFLKWFWKNFTLEFTSDAKVRNQPSINAELCGPNADYLKACNHWMHDNSMPGTIFSPLRIIQNITIDVLASSYDHRHLAIGGDNTTLPDLKLLFENIGLLKRIKNLTVYFWVHRNDIQKMIDKPRQYKWIKALQGIPVSKSFTLELRIFGIERMQKYRREDWPEKTQEKKELKELREQAVLQEKLRELMMPRTLLTDPQDFGLSLLFG
jgi:hypothetical protein